MKTIQGVSDKVVVEVVQDKEKKVRGIIVPETVKTEPQEYGIVTSVGPAVEGIEVGDTIIFHRNGGQAIIFNGKIMRVLNYTEVYGVLVDGK